MTRTAIGKKNGGGEKGGVDTQERIRNTHSLLTIGAPGLHRHAEVAGLDLAAVHRHGRVLTHEAGHNVGAAWPQR